MEINEGAEAEIVATDGIDIIAADIEHCDGLALGRDYSSAFAVSYMGGFLWKVDIDKETGVGSTSVVKQHLVSPTHVELTYADDTPKLFVVCCGQIEHGWMNDDARSSWSDLANINAAVSVTVTVSEEVAEVA